MANQLKMSFIDPILTLHSQGWSQRAIARRLSVHRDMVRQHVHLAADLSKPPTVNAATYVVPWHKHEMIGTTTCIVRDPIGGHRRQSCVREPVPFLVNHNKIWTSVSESSGFHFSCKVPVRETLRPVTQQLNL